LTSDGRLQLGVVGLGYWGPNLARNIAEHPRTELRWLCDLNERVLAAASQRHPGARTTTQIDDLLSDPELDAVAIVTPVSTHYELCVDALDAGKHVLVEKPLANSSQEALDLIERAEKANVVLMPGHTFLYSPPVLKIKELLDTNALGDIYFISMSRVNLGLHQPDVSVVWDLGPHDFSILRYWLGRLPDHVSALTRDCVVPGTPDVAFVNMRFGAGMVAHLELSWLAPSKLRRTAIVGSDKMLVYDDLSSEPIRIFNSGAELRDPETFGEYRLTYRTGDITSPKIEATEPLSLVLGDFSAAVIDGTTPRSSAVIGLDVIRAIEAVDRSLAVDGAPAAIQNGARTVTGRKHRPRSRAAVKRTASPSGDAQG
jgi:predicted dehydrogenase